MMDMKRRRPFPSPLEGEGGRRGRAGRVRGAGGALSGDGAARTPHPYPLPQGERGSARVALRISP